MVGLAGCAGWYRPPPEVPPAPLAGTTWLLVSLDGQPLPKALFGREPELRLDPQRRQASGWSGLNRFASEFVLDGNRVRFGRVVSPGASGPAELAAVEASLAKALESTSSYRIRADTLVLLDRAQLEAARFIARPGERPATAGVGRAGSQARPTGARDDAAERSTPSRATTGRTP